MLHPPAKAAAGHPTLKEIRKEASKQLFFAEKSSHRRGHLDASGYFPSEASVPFMKR